jgi:hypothetical protein
VSQGLASVRKAARKDKKVRFTALLHHLTVDRLGVSLGQGSASEFVCAAADGPEERPRPDRGRFRKRIAEHAKRTHVLKIHDLGRLQKDESPALSICL